MDYLGVMVMIPPKPRVIVQDTVSFFTRRERHSWVALVMAIAIPTVVIGVFAADSASGIEPTEPTITYVESWSADRTDEEIIERQRVLALAENERRALSRQRFQELADASGVDYDREAAAEADRITEENRRTLARPQDGETTEQSTDGS
jgi:hypothetical protein